MYRNILIATDGSELATKAVTQGVALAKALNAQVTIMTATEPWSSVVSGDVVFSFPIDEYDKTVAAHATQILAKASEIAALAGVRCDTAHAKNQHPAEGILATAKARDCDLIVMASHGRRGLSRMLLGSQANRVVTHSALPVLVCR
jgi:nucleotide-binding universal stress UspA family protein